MQGGRSASAVAAAKEAAANVGASAWAGKEKTKAVVEEKVAKARARDPAEKAAADARMEEHVRGVEAAKRDTMRQNAAAKERASAAEHHPTPLGVAAAPPVPAGPGVHVLDRSAVPAPAANATDGGHSATGGVPVGAAARPDAAAGAGAGTGGGVPPASGTA
ncbi:18 kDa seed maturation protein-like [Panicum virgatum]|uniref:Uncharacterized protein n=1 Tax=Panicum virgatum TaxID=38727 RepID=A0A8T0VC48_PANVG|nr:18 kDa seed maturation protein-like [Panicum virgatum]KAG2633942.1 hypothetical protein PVAP13_2NG255600 [Panicum virgatum]